MNFYVCRALEVGRLTDAQLDVVHQAELQDGRGCLTPSGIQDAFQLPTLKAHYAVPTGTKGRELAAADHWRRVARDIADTGALSGFIPPASLLTEFHVANVHEFDARIRHAVLDGRLKFRYEVVASGPKPAHDPDQFHPHFGARGRLFDTDRRTAASDGYPDD